MTRPPFVFDTSVFVSAWRYHYNFDLFPAYWELLGNALDDGRVVVPRSVYGELDMGGDDLVKWVRRWPKAIIEATPGIQARIVDVHDHAPKKWFDGSGRHDADPWVVATALEIDGCVVSYEGIKLSGEVNGKTANMRGVCDRMEVPCSPPWAVWTALQESQPS